MSGTKNEENEENEVGCYIGAKLAGLPLDVLEGGEKQLVTNAW